MSDIVRRRPELLAPAGSADSAFAALQYGADAIYAGLTRFSARAEAENLALDQLSEVVAYAHGLSPARKVYVTVNTVVLDDELPELVETLAAIADLGVDAVIVQDLGVLRAAKICFPRLRIHASTQMAVHSAAGAAAARDLGARRVTLARELTLDEVQAACAVPGIEIEVFVHGALCYSYSGLCLYSSLLRQRSGNRGRCTYPCRDLFEAGKKVGGLFPFSMKDLALGDDTTELARAGVACLKIEGRKKSPLYVAATTAYYRAIIDGTAGKGELRERAEEIRTIFSRPWTSLYLRGRGARDVCDTGTVGHRGARAGEVDSVRGPRNGPRFLRFTAKRAMERHDGLQVDLPGPGKPFGFAVTRLFVVDKTGRRRSVVRVEAGTTVEVELPADHPALPCGAPLYHASSQQVKRSYPFTRPRPGEHGVRCRLDVETRIEPERLRASAVVSGIGEEPVELSVESAGTFDKGRNPALTERAARQAFSKLGGTGFGPGSITVVNKEGLFVPISALNDLRRALVEAATGAAAARRASRAAACVERLQAPEPQAFLTPGRSEPRWSLKTDGLGVFGEFGDDDWEALDEAVIDLSAGDQAALEAEIALLAQRIGHERIRPALPMIVRRDEEAGVRAKVRALAGRGFRRWEAANVASLTYLREEAGGGEPDVSADWPLYVVNSSAATQTLLMGIGRFALSPEDGMNNMCEITRRFGDRATVIAYQDTPLLVSETCALANIRGACAGRTGCDRVPAALVSAQKERVKVVQRGCRSVVISEQPFSMARSVGRLRAAGARRFRVDLMWGAYTAEEAVRVWRAVRSGETPQGALERRAHALA